MLYIAISKSISLFEISMAATNITHKLATVLVILRRRRRRRQKAKAKTKRKFWISPLNAKRSLLGAHNSTFLLMMMMMMMMMMMNCFCGMVDRRRALSLISTRDHCQKSSPSRIPDTPRAGFEPAQNLSQALLNEIVQQ